MKDIEIIAKAIELGASPKTTDKGGKHMTCIEFAAGSSDERARREVIINCCPQDFYRLKNTPAICGGEMNAATEAMCDKCWRQEAHPIE